MKICYKKKTILEKLSTTSMTSFLRNNPPVQNTHAIHALDFIAASPTQNHKSVNLVQILSMNFYSGPILQWRQWMFTSVKYIDIKFSLIQMYGILPCSELLPMLYWP